LTFHNGFSFGRALRLSLFNVVSIMTTTGLASCDYLNWGVTTTVFLTLLSLHGGCIGSTTGSVKVMRWQVLQAFFNKLSKSAVEPNRIIPVRTGDLPIGDSVVNSVLAYIMLFLVSIAFFALCLNLAGYDFSSSFSTAVAIITNTGPGTAKAIGPMGNFSFFPPAVRYFLSIGMLLGRLEIITFLVILTRSFWKF
jgi:trk system potassium uptake protein TrkH